MATSAPGSQVVKVSDIDRSIHGVAKTVAEVLEKKKYSIDYYQREYKWEAKQLTELVNDLTRSSSTCTSRTTRVRM